MINSKIDDTYRKQNVHNEQIVKYSMGGVCD